MIGGEFVAFFEANLLVVVAVREIQRKKEKRREGHTRVQYRTGLDTALADASN